MRPEYNVQYELLFNAIQPRSRQLNVKVLKRRELESTDLYFLRLLSAGRSRVSSPVCGSDILNILLITLRLVIL